MDGEHFNVMDAKHSQPGFCVNFMLMCPVVVVLGFILWKWATRSDSADPNLDCRIGSKVKPNFMWSLHGTKERKFVQMVQVT